MSNEKLFSNISCDDPIPTAGAETLEDTRKEIVVIGGFGLPTGYSFPDGYKIVDERSWMDGCRELEIPKCKADPDEFDRKHRTNKKLQNQPYHLRDRTGKMRKW